MISYENYCMVLVYVVFVLSQGKIVESGSPKELMEKKGQKLEISLPTLNMKIKMGKFIL